MIYNTILFGVCHIFLDKTMSCASFSTAVKFGQLVVSRDQRPIPQSLVECIWVCLKIGYIPNEIAI